VGDLIASNHDFRRYSTIHDLFVGTSAVKPNEQLPMSVFP